MHEVVNQATRTNQDRTRFRDSISCSHRTGAAVDIYAQLTNQNKKDATNALIWAALKANPIDLARVNELLPKLQPAEAMESPTIEWNRHAPASEGGRA